MPCCEDCPTELTDRAAQDILGERNRIVCDQCAENESRAPHPALSPAQRRCLAHIRDHRNLPHARALRSAQVLERRGLAFFVTIKEGPFGATWQITMRGHIALADPAEMAAAIAEVTARRANTPPR